MSAALAPLATAIAGRPCVVVGAAPLAAPLVIPPEACLVVVNGGISSVRDREPDVWALNSRTGPYPGWDADPKRLAALMLAQGAKRRVGLAVLFTREDEAPPVTLGILKKQGTTVVASLPIRQDLRTALETEAGARTPAMTKYAISAGMTTVALCLLAGAPTVTLEGFSWDGGYQYTAEPVRRGHVFGDQCALANLRDAHPDRLATSLPVPLKAQRAKETRMATAKKAAAPAKPITVRAKKLGFYQSQRRYPGAVFRFLPATAESKLPSWIEAVPDDTPLTRSGRGAVEDDAPARPRVRRLQPNAVDPIVEPVAPGAPNTLAQDQNVLG